MMIEVTVRNITGILKQINYVLIQCEYNCIYSFLGIYFRQQTQLYDNNLIQRPCYVPNSNFYLHFKVSKYLKTSGVFVCIITLTDFLVQ